MPPPRGTRCAAPVRPLTTAMVGDLDAINHLMDGDHLPSEVSVEIRQSLQDLSPKELAQMLQMYRQAAGQ